MTLEKKHRPVCGMGGGLRSHLWQNKGQGLFLVTTSRNLASLSFRESQDERKGLELNDLLINQDTLMGFDLR